MKYVLLLSLLPLLFASLCDCLFVTSFQKELQKASVLVEENLSKERMPSLGLGDGIVFVLVSDMDDPRLESIIYRLRSTHPLLLTGKPYSREFVHYRKLS